MANYSQLKAAIDAVIKTNGNQEITGAVLQTVLDNIVNVIGANYTFAGVATPSTNPGTPDQNVFYLASEAGVYTNYGGVELAQGLYVLLWNGTWDVKGFLSINDLYNEIRIIHQDLDNIEKSYNDLSEEIDISELPAFQYVIDSDNKYTTIPESSNASARVVKIPSFSKYLYVTSNSRYNSIVAFLKNTNVPVSREPNFAKNYEGRITIPKATTVRFELNEETNFLYFSRTTTQSQNITPANINAEFNNGRKKKFGILFIGSSGEQDMVAYVPPILSETLQDYDVYVGDMYKSGAQATEYVDGYEEDVPCERFNYWDPTTQKWQLQYSLLLENVLAICRWDLIVFKGSITNCRELMRIIQSIIDYPVSFVTDARVPRVYDGTWQLIMEDEVNPLVKNTGFIGYFPVATAIQDARSNDILKMTGGISLAEETQFTIPAGRYYSFYHKIRALSGNPSVIKATRLTGDGSVKIYASSTAAGSDNLLLTLDDNTEKTVSFGGGTNYIKIVNDGNQACTIKISDSNSEGNYMLSTDNQHVQAGIPELISAYTIVLKILEWTGNTNKGINGTSFVPTGVNLINIGAANESGLSTNLGHGFSCGVDNYIDSDGNVYDRSQLTEYDGILYVSTTVYDNTPDINSITASLDTDNPINYRNIYAAQEVATIAVRSSDELIDCSDVNIEVPQKDN